MTSPTLTRVVGAYAALPADRTEQERLYAGLAQRGLATALEVPDWALLGPDETDREWFLHQLQGRFEDCVVTAVPGTMTRQQSQPGFGLAAAQEGQRLAAVDFHRSLREAAEQANQAAGSSVFAVLEIHSAPSGAASAEALRRSLEDLAEGSWSTRLVLEHCDAAGDQFPGQKRFLPLHAEIDAAREHGIGVAVNWGRSALEEHDADAPLRHLRAAAEAGVLEGLVLSGAGPETSAYGGSWADAHLPLESDEPTSLMDAGAVAASFSAAGSSLRWAGAKVQAPQDASVEQRLDIIASIMDLVPSAS